MVSKCGMYNLRFPKICGCFKNNRFSKKPINISNFITIDGMCNVGRKSMSNFVKSNYFGCTPGNSVENKYPVIIKNSFSEEDNNDLMAVFPQLVDDLTNTKPCQNYPKLAKRISDVLYYTVQPGRNPRTLATLYSYKKLEAAANLTSDNIRLAAIMAWCVKMLEAHTVILDDIIDDDYYRYQGLCWHRRADVGLSAVVDADFIEKGLYFLLNKYFSKHPQYLNLMELYSDVLFKVSIGQIADTMKHNIEECTMEIYYKIITNKSGYLIYYVPVLAVMYLVDKFEPEVYRQIKPILIDMGLFFQIQDDFLDCYGNTREIGKSGSDIKNGKMTWLLVVALQKANAEQSKVLKEHHGKSDIESINSVKNIYDELKIDEEYKVFEDNTYKRIGCEIDKLPKSLPRDLFHKLLEKQYHRNFS